MTEFPTSMEEFGRQEFPGKILRARVGTAAEWDEQRQTGGTLSRKVGAEQKIFILIADDLSSLTGRLRAQFYMPETTLVSKWGGFVSALDKLGVQFLIDPQTGISNLEGRYFWLAEFEKSFGAKYGRGRTIEIRGIMTPEEIKRYEERRKGISVTEPTTESTPKAASKLDEVIEMILTLDFSEGKTAPEIIDEMRDFGFISPHDEELVREAIGELRARGRLTLHEKKLWLTE